MHSYFLPSAAWRSCRWYILTLTFAIILLPEKGISQTSSNPCIGAVFLSSQAAVDTFSCTQIGGNLIIQGEDIVDLSPLFVLERIGGGLFINENTSLRTLTGLENLQFARTLVIFGNAVLEDISALETIRLSVDIDVLEDGIIVSANPLLCACCIIPQILTRGQRSIGQNARGCNSLSEVAFKCDSANQVTGFMLVNASTDEDIGLLEDQATLNLDSLADIPLSIRVLLASPAVGTVAIGLKGPVQRFRFEREPPYTLLGDGENGLYSGIILPPGYYHLTATPYEDDPITGRLGKTVTIAFSVSAPNPSITGLTLVNADTQEDLFPLIQGVKLICKPSAQTC